MARRSSVGIQRPSRGSVRTQPVAQGHQEDVTLTSETVRVFHLLQSQLDDHQHRLIYFHQSVKR
jgi:hypothetical protein